MSNYITIQPEDKVCVNCQNCRVYALHEYGEVFFINNCLCRLKHSNDHMPGRKACKDFERLSESMAY